MTTTFQKRQKEMKRLDKQKEKAERRAQRKIEKREGTGTNPDDDVLTKVLTEPAQLMPD